MSTPVTMTTEERVAQMEIRLDIMHKTLEEMKMSVDELNNYARTGKGVLWFFVKAGIGLAGFVGFAKLVWDTIHPVVAK